MPMAFEPLAERIRLVRDNLSTHTATAFYVTFPRSAPAGWRGASVEFAHAPVHRS